ncbi:hypothetical protein JWG39_06730 [Desulforhopalus vacuolatus]|uniref:hypothetical protein n=1 Tax=Desulforhopalus vacuolatus TaxID=40414 RepID=UPI001965B156|nr:hypothetical protein [Desulforhopalus vacuolatus]MBM9519514.1 hypothetical protein [Desulforhopalus vacuolatus]
MKPSLRKALHWTGSALSLAGIVFVSIRLKEYFEGQNFASISLVSWGTIGGLAIIYAVANLLLALAWRQILVQFDSPVTRKWSIQVYGVSQLAKYVPGNIFHLAGRQALGMSAGIPGNTLAKSIFWELALSAVAGTLFGSLLLPLWIPDLPTLATATLLLASCCFISILLRQFVGTAASAAFWIQLLFLSVTAGIFVSLLEIINQGETYQFHTWVVMGGAYVIAWLCGLITPGAPAGVGMREFILLFLLKGLVVDADLLIAVLLGRIVSVVGDVLYYLYAVFSGKE